MLPLQISGLSKSYTGESVAALTEVSLEVIEGEILALLGESGSGKTTLLRLIAGFEHPTAGQIRIKDQLVAGTGIFKPPEQRQVGMVFQDYALFPHLTVAANIQYGLHQWPKGQKKERLAEILAWVGLEGSEKKYPHQLSGGQQQRVALARALAPAPSLLLMDEPFSNLDSQLKDLVREEVRKTLKQAGATAIFVTHDVRDALSTADRIVVLKSGQVQQIGTPLEIYRSPANTYVANFFGKTSLLSATIASGGFESEIGFIPAVVNQSTGSGWLCLRPEHIIIGSTSTEGSQGFQGKVVSVHYYGDHRQLLLGVSEQINLWTKAPQQASYQPGDILHFTIDPTHLQLLGAI